MAKAGTNQVEVQIYTEEVLEGREYSGSISFNGHRFKYRLFLEFHLEELEELADVDPEGAMEHVNIELMKNGSPLGLEQKYKRLFAGPVMLAYYSYYQGRRRKEKTYLLPKDELMEDFLKAYCD